MWPVADAGDVDDDDDDVAEREREIERAAAAARRRVVELAAADAVSRQPTRTSATADVAGDSSTTDRGDSDRCSRTKRAVDYWRAATLALTRPSWQSSGCRTGGRGFASSRKARNAIPDRRARRCRGQSLRR